MQIKAHGSLSRVTSFIENMINKPTTGMAQMASKALQGATLEVGPADHGDFAVNDPGMDAPLYVGDSLYGSDVYKSNEVANLVKAGAADKLGMYYKRNAQGKFDIVWNKAGVGDAAPDLIGAQYLSPGSVGYFTDIFRKPLVWSNASKFVSIHTGTNPWAEAMTLVAEDYSGFAGLTTAGALSNNASNDVEVNTGMMTQAVMNTSVTYRLSIEELERAKNPNSAYPFNGQPIAHKQQYAQWVLDILRDYLTYYGNTATGMYGLFTVNGTTSYGTSLTTIAGSSSGTEGQEMYIGLATKIATFLTNSQNMLKTVRIGMSPLALNLLSTYNYSKTYNPQTAIKTLVDNFLAGEGKSGVTPDIEIFSDPLLAANTIFNTSAHDYLVIAAPEIVGGPNDQPQSLIRLGMPLPEFVYPVIPGMQGTPYKTLRRISGIFAPYSPAVAVYSGFGV